MHFLMDEKGNDSFWLTFKLISSLQNTLQLNLLFIQLKKSILYCVANSWWHVKKTGAGQKHLLRELLHFLKGRCFLPLI